MVVAPQKMMRAFATPGKTGVVGFDFFLAAAMEHQGDGIASSKEVRLNNGLFSIHPDRLLHSSLM